MTVRLEWEQRFSIPINGVDYTVGLATKDAFMEAVSEDITEAITDARAALITIVETVPDVRRPYVFWHEFIHAAFGEVGYTMYAHLVGCEESESRKSQERLACFLGPILTTTIGGPDAIYDMLKGPIRTKGTGAPQARAEGRGSRATETRRRRAR